MKKFIIFILIMMIPLLILILSDNYFSNRTAVYVKNQAQLQATNAFNQVITNSIIPDLNSSQLVDIKYKQDQNIASIIINTSIANTILNQAKNIINQILEEEALVTNLQIPIGSLISKALLSGLGPNVNIKIIPLTSYQADLYTDHQLLGINNHLVEVFLKIDIIVDVLVPLNITTINITTKIILFSEVVYGQVPNYYYSNNGQSDPNFPYVPS